MSLLPKDVTVSAPEGESMRVTAGNLHRVELEYKDSLFKLQPRFNTVKEKSGM